MADKILPLLRGKIESSTSFRDPRGGDNDDVELPTRDAAKHRRKLLSDLDAIANGLAKATRDPDARRAIVAAHATPDAPFPADSLGDKGTDVRLVGVDPDSRIIIIDTADPRFAQLRRKLDEYVDDGKISRSGARRNEPLFAVLEGLHLGTHEDLAGPDALRLELAEITPRWFEIGCRGGARRPEAENANTRAQIRRQLHGMGIGEPVEFLATEELVFFARLSIKDLRILVARVDCVYEYELVRPQLRDWLLLEREPAARLREFKLTPPPAHAPSVVLLDTGIATKHPLLSAAILQSRSVVPSDASPEDTDGHGTQTAGVALYDDLGAAVVEGRYAARHWLESSRLLKAPQSGSAAEDGRNYWPALTMAAVEGIEGGGDVRARIYCMTVTSWVEEIKATFWSHALDRLAFNDGAGRLLCVSAGNADVSDLALLNDYPQLHLAQRVQDPAQASNVLTVGAYTEKTTLPPEPTYASLKALAPMGGVSPYTSAGQLASAAKPDIVMEGGNVGFDGKLPGVGIETLSSLTTGMEHVRRPLSHIWATSEAVAHAARVAAGVWRMNPELRPETVRGLLVHSASWTDAMLQQFPTVDDRLRVCGYGVPDGAFARACVANRATVIVEDAMPSAVHEEVPRKEAPKRATTKPTETKTRRNAMFFRLPVPEDELLAEPTREVELRVTLSYFGEPNTFRRRVVYGLDLKWDMQGPQETEEKFKKRINLLARAGEKRKKWGKSFPWDIGIQRRSRGTVQSDRWRGPASMLAGTKLLAVMPVLGWWNRRAHLETMAQSFSLIVTVVADDIYTSIAAAIVSAVQVKVET